MSQSLYVLNLFPAAYVWHLQDGALRYVRGVYMYMYIHALFMCNRQGRLYFQFAQGLLTVLT